MTIGIYGIFGPETRVYIGQSKDIEYRWSSHKTMLRHDKHHCSHLQHAWNLHGELTFTHEILIECAADALQAHEQAEMDYHREFLYNSAPIAGSQREFKHSEDSKLKMSVAHFGATRSAKSCENIRAALRRKFDDPVFYTKWAENRTLLTGKRVVLSDGQEFESITAFAIRCGYQRCAAVTTQLGRGVTLEEIAERRGVLTGSSAYRGKQIILSDGRIFANKREFARRCGYANDKGLWMLMNKYGHTYETIAAMRNEHLIKETPNENA